MKKILVSCVVGLILSGIAYSTVYAYSFGVNLNHNSWDLGFKGGGIAAEKTGYFSASNTSGSLEGLKISATDNKGWTVGDTAAADVFVLEHKPTSGGSYVKVASDGSTYLKEELTPSASHAFDLRFTAPTSTTQTGEHTITNTITTTGPSGYTYNATGDFYYKCLGFGSNCTTDWSGAYDHVPVYLETCLSSLVGSVLTHSLLTSYMSSSNWAGGTQYFWQSNYWVTSGLVLGPPLSTKSEPGKAGCSSYCELYAMGCDVNSQIHDTTWLMFNEECRTVIGGNRHYRNSYFYYPAFVILD